MNKTATHKENFVKNEKKCYSASIVKPHFSGNGVLYHLGKDVDVVLGVGRTSFSTIIGESVADVFDKGLDKVEFEAIDLSELSTEDIEEAMPYLKGVKYLALTKCEGVDDLSFIEEMPDLRALEILRNYKAERLPDFSRHTNLKSLDLRAYRCISDFSGLADSNIEDLVIIDGAVAVNKTQIPMFSDFEVLSEMPKLRRLKLYCHTECHSKNILTALARLTHLESIELIRVFFTFEQFAWLSAKLPNVKGLEPIKKYEGYDDEPTTYEVIGRGAPKNLKTRRARDRYEAKYFELIEKYKTQDTPPADNVKER